MIHDSVEKATSNQGGCGSKVAPSQEDIQNQMVSDVLSKIKNKLFIMSGKGGVGKSSISANIAVALADKGFKTGLMDVDLHGPSIAHIMGISELLDISENRLLLPYKCDNNLKVVSMQSLIQDKDQAIIWRGPAKNGMIKQFVGSVNWGELDFLIIDSPPGTGDEPLTVVQTIDDVKAIVITTPQDVALADVRKSLNFCKTVNIKTVGIIENMGPFKCPHCNDIIEIFKSGGGERTAKTMNVPFLGTLPFDPEVVKYCDNGEPIIIKDKSNNFSKTLNGIVDKIIKSL